MTRGVIKTARRIFEILEQFDEVQRPLSLKEVASHFDYPVSSASAVLKSMVELGYINYDRYSRTYMPTMRVVHLGRWVQDAISGERGISTLLNYLSRETEESVAIAAQSDLYMQYIYTQPSPRTMRTTVQPGALRPLARSGLGWMLLSARSDDTIEMLVRRINFAEPDRALRVDLKDLMKRIHSIRKDGHVVSLDTVKVGAGIIGMLLPQRRHGRVLAIGVGAPVERLVKNRTRIVDALQQGIEKLALKKDVDTNNFSACL